MPLSADTPAPVSATTRPSPRRACASPRLQAARICSMAGCYTRNHGAVRRRRGRRLRLRLLLLEGEQRGADASSGRSRRPARRSRSPPRSRSRSPSTARRSPRSPPARCAAREPDFADDERKAWRIPTLVAEAGPPGIVEATSPTGVSVKFAHPTPDGLEPVLFLTRRGEVIVAARRSEGSVPALPRPGRPPAPRRRSAAARRAGLEAPHHAHQAVTPSPASSISTIAPSGAGPKPSRRVPSRAASARAIQPNVSRALISHSG